MATVSAITSGIQPSQKKKNSPIKKGAKIGAGIGTLAAGYNLFRGREILKNIYNQGIALGGKKSIIIATLSSVVLFGALIPISIAAVVGTAIGALVKVFNKPKADKQKLTQFA